MDKKQLAKAVAAVVISAPMWALAQPGGSSTPGTAGGTVTAPAAGTTAPAARAGAANAGLAAADARFVMKAAESDSAELGTSKLALQKGSSEAVKKYAQMMIDEHTKTSERLRSLAQAKNVDLPKDELPGKHQRMLDRLGKLEGERFDREYMRGQESAHKDAVRLYERQANSGRDPDLKKFASDLLPNLRGHLQMAQQNQGKTATRTDAADRSATVAGAAGRSTDKSAK